MTQWQFGVGALADDQTRLVTISWRTLGAQKQVSEAKAVPEAFEMYLS